MGSGAVRREGSAAEPARASVGLVAGFVSAGPSVAVGGRYRPLGGDGWMWPGLGALFPAAVCLQGEKRFFSVFFKELMLLLCVMASTSTVNFLF